MRWQRGWTNFESGVSTAVLERAAAFTGLSAVLEKLPPKLHDISAEGSTPVIEKLDPACVGERMEEVRKKIEGAFFTGKGDKPKVVQLYKDCTARRDSNAAATERHPTGDGGAMLGQM